MNYKDHPLLRLSLERHSEDQPMLDQSPLQKSFLKESLAEKVLNSLRNTIYPLRNFLEYKRNIRLLRQLHWSGSFSDQPDIIGLGHKGYSQEIFLRRIKSVIGEHIGVIICYGCGMGDEALKVAKILKPQKIIGIDYFNYESYWKSVKQELANSYKIEAQFIQIQQGKIPEEILGSADLIYSHAVLEHINDMDRTFVMIKSLMRKNAFFAAQWGPMWYSYSGDHISGELGLQFGFSHLLLPTDGYVNFYMTHPRNKNDVGNGVPTWMELGLHNFGRYGEYIQALTHYFGNVLFLHWVLSPEAFRFKKMYEKEWNQILHRHQHINELDLILQCAGILLQ